MAIHGHGGNDALFLTRLFSMPRPISCTCLLLASTAKRWWAPTSLRYVVAPGRKLVVHSWACRGALTCTWTPRGATRRQGIRGLAAQPELQCPVIGLRGVLHGSPHLDSITRAVHGLYPGGLGYLLTNDRSRTVCGHYARNSVLGRSLPPPLGYPQEGRQDGTVAAKPRPKAGDTFVGGRPLVKASFLFYPAM